MDQYKFLLKTMRKNKNSLRVYNKINIFGEQIIEQVMNFLYLATD
jgi:hypothetical protein